LRAKVMGSKVVGQTPKGNKKETNQATLKKKKKKNKVRSPN